MKPREKGVFISIEGPDWSGKSTQIENIKDFFKAKNRRFFIVNTLYFWAFCYKIL